MARQLQLEILGKLPQSVAAKSLQQAFGLVVAEFKVKQTGSINCIFVSRIASRALNEQFADHNYATDVLSFNYLEGEDAAQADGGTMAEIAICSAIAKEQASKAGNSIEDEVVLLLVHGLMHIFGNDHATDAQQASFGKLQGAIMKKLNRNARQLEWSH